MNSQHTLLDDRRVIRLLAKLSLPAMIGLPVNNLYTMVDMFFIGRPVGPVGLAALWISMGGYLILTATALMMGIGESPLVFHSLHPCWALMLRPTRWCEAAWEWISTHRSLHRPECTLAFPREGKGIDGRRHHRKWVQYPA